MTHDRTYWRACDDKRLIEEAYDSGHELCIAIGERLERIADIADEAYALKLERDDLRRQVERLCRELDEYEQVND